MKTVINYLKALYHNKNLLRIIAVVLLAFSLGYRLGVHNNTPQQPAKRLPCDLHQGACAVDVSGNRHIKVSIEPKTIPSDQVITVFVTLEEFKAPLVSISLATLPQNSPFNQVSANSIGNNKFSAQFKLTDFGPSHKNWLMLVKIDSGSQTITVPFKFEAM